MYIRLMTSISILKNKMINFELIGELNINR